jgi:hypothetical protein
MAARLPKQPEGPPDMPSWCHIGAKCQCIRQFGGAGRFIRPILRQIYTIREFDVMPPAPTFLRFEEIVQGPGTDGFEPSFDPTYFAPLVTRTQEQDVSRFRKHLRTKPIRTDAFVKIPHEGEIS